MDRGTVLRVFAIVLLVSLSGCVGFLDDDLSFDDEQRAEVYEAATDSMNEDKTEAFTGAITEDGEVTTAGQTVLDQLVQIERLGPEYRNGVAQAIAEHGEVTKQTTAGLERVLSSPESFQKTVFTNGGVDKTGNGILDGEMETFGLSPTEASPARIDLLKTLGEGGYNPVAIDFLQEVGETEQREETNAIVTGLATDGVDSTDVEYLDRVSASKQYDFIRTQVLTVALETTADGDVTEDDIKQLKDTNGDGLLAAMAELLGLDPAANNADIVPAAEQLAADGYDDTDLEFLRTVSDYLHDEFRWVQANTTLKEMTADGDVSQQDITTIQDESGDGLINAYAASLGLSTHQQHPVIADIAEAMAADGFNSVEYDYLEQTATLKSDTFKWRQLQYLGPVALWNETPPHGEVTEKNIQRIQDSTGDGLLNGMARLFWAEPIPFSRGYQEETEIAELLEPLLQDPFGDVEKQYLDRLVEISKYRGNEYEVWAQAKELGLLHDATRDGEITDDQLWAIQNNGDDRLLNGMEAKIGTDPEEGDTSQDGYLDHLKWGPMQDRGLNVDPTEIDVFIELDTASGVSVPDSRATELDDIEEIMNDERPDDVPQINLHFKQCSTDRPAVTTADGMDQNIESLREIPGLGFHYMLLTDGTVTSSDGSDAGGLADPDGYWMLVNAEEQLSNEWILSTITHEMGHIFGLDPSDFNGIDSESYSQQEYESVMNYNTDYQQITFSTGEPFNDYEDMVEDRFGVADNSELNQMWDTGTADKGSLC